MRTSGALLVMMVLTSCEVEARELPFDGGWELSGDARVDDFMGERALRMSSARAIARDVVLEDGTLELDVATNGQRSFVYVQFRMQSDGEHEELYFRPHKSELPDAIQYTPVYRGEGNWQLYHGDGSTAPAPFPSDAWIHLKIVVSGDRAAVFVGDAGEPQLLISDLARARAPGYVALRSFVPPGQPDRGPATSFANVVVRPGEVDYAFPDAAGTSSPPGVIESWLVSEALDAPEGALKKIPAVAGGRELEADASGLVVFGRDVARPEGSRRSTVLAKITLTADGAKRVPFHFGYSDEVTVFLNGAPLFSADDSYSFDRPRREGLIGFDQATVYLPLAAGENELVLAVTDVFGGWAVMGRLDDPAAARVSAK